MAVIENAEPEHWKTYRFSPPSRILPRSRSCFDLEGLGTSSGYMRKCKLQVERRQEGSENGRRQTCCRIFFLNWRSSGQFKMFRSQANADAMLEVVIFFFSSTAALWRFVLKYPRCFSRDAVVATVVEFWQSGTLHN